MPLSSHGLSPILRLSCTSALVLQGDRYGIKWRIMQHLTSGRDGSNKASRIQRCLNDRGSVEFFTVWEVQVGLVTLTNTRFASRLMEDVTIRATGSSTQETVSCIFRPGATLRPSNSGFPMAEVGLSAATMVSFYRLVQRKLSLDYPLSIFLLLYLCKGKDADVLYQCSYRRRLYASC